MMVFGLDFRLAEIGGGLLRRPLVFDRDGRVLPAETLPALGAAGPLTFLLHGFNQSRSEGRRALLGFARLVEQQTPELDTRLAAVLWPGDDLLSPLSYALEERDARQAAGALAQLCLEVWRLREPPSFVAHSLGCLVALEAMKRLERGGLATARALLLAGAVDADALARSDRYRRAVEAAERVDVLHSRSDRVLRWAYPLGDAFAGLLFGGYTRPALGYAGPRRAAAATPANVSDLSLTHRGVGHGDYLPGRTISALHTSTAHYAGGFLGRSTSPRYP